MKNFEPIERCAFGKLADKVDLSPDFFTGFEPARRREIVTEEAAFYHSITQPYSVDDRIDKFWVEMPGYEGEQIRVKCYQPKGAEGRLPALVFMHGGGFITCSVETHDFVPSYLAANAGVRAFSIEYRLAPEYKFPIGLEDCYAVLRHIASHAEELGVAEDKIAVCGDSSGGNFAAVLSLMARERGDVKIGRQVLIYPCTEMSGTVPRRSAEVYAPVGGGDDAGESFLERYLHSAAEEAALPHVSPMLAGDFAGLPPALFIIAECDSLADDGLIYAKLLKDAGVPVDYSIYHGMPHAFILRVYSETFAALDRICDYLKDFGGESC